MLGAIGSKDIDDVILFEVSSEVLLTIDNFVRRNRVRFAKHDVLLRKPVSQYIGPELDDITFQIVLKAQFGVNPQEEFNKLIHLQRRGATLSMLLGKTAFGTFRWRIVNLTNPWEIINDKGQCMSSTIDISLEEYV